MPEQRAKNVRRGSQFAMPRGKRSPKVVHRRVPNAEGMPMANKSTGDGGRRDGFSVSGAWE